MDRSTICSATRSRTGWGAGRDGEINYVDLVIQGLLARWAILPMLNGYARHLNAIRDSTALRPSARTNALKVLDALGRHVSYNADIAAVTSELIPFAENAHLFEHDMATFKPARLDRYSASHTLEAGIRNLVLQQATWLQKSDLSVRDHLTQYGSLLGSSENVKLQQKLGTLTWIIIILTVAILVLTLLTLVAAAGEAGGGRTSSTSSSTIGRTSSKVASGCVAHAEISCIGLVSREMAARLASDSKRCRTRS